VIHFRLASIDPHEIAKILDFWVANAENGSRPTDTSDAIRALIEKDPEALILAIDNDEIVGTIIAGWNGWRSGLYRLAVREDRRSQGIGRILVERAIERLISLGVKRVDAMVLNDNETAHSAWESYGFTCQNNWSRWVKNL
jgi:ribosomal protein S18 acetylase RimI-like enzyme